MPGARSGDRATAPAVGKAMEAGIVVLYVGLLTTTLFGGYVADYRTAAGDELGDRALATASHQIRAAIPPGTTAAQVHVRVEVPDTIRGDGYRIRAEGRSLVLDHPDAGVGGRTRLAFPDRVDEFEGTWNSQRPAAVRVAGTGDGLSVRLVSGDTAEEGLDPGDDDRCERRPPFRPPDRCDDDDDDRCGEWPPVGPPDGCDDDDDDRCGEWPPVGPPDGCDGGGDGPPHDDPPCDDERGPPSSGDPGVCDGEDDGPGPPSGGGGR